MVATCSSSGSGHWHAALTHDSTKHAEALIITADLHFLVLDVPSIMEKTKQGLGGRYLAPCLLDVAFRGVQTSSSYSLNCSLTKKQSEINFYLSQTKNVFVFVFF